MVFTVSATTRSTTYMVSPNDGSLTEVEAHSGRWICAPLARSACQRSVAIRCSNSS